LGVKFGEEGVIDVSQILKRSGRDMGLLYAKNRVDIFCHLSTMHERVRQTDRQTERETPKR